MKTYEPEWRVAWRAFLEKVPSSAAKLVAEAGIKHGTYNNWMRTTPAGEPSISDATCDCQILSKSGYLRDFRKSALAFLLPASSARRTISMSRSVGSFAFSDPLRTHFSSRSLAIVPRTSR